MELWSKGSVQVKILIVFITCHKIAACCIRILVKVNVLNIFVSNLREQSLACLTILKHGQAELFIPIDKNSSNFRANNLHFDNEIGGDFTEEVDSIGFSGPDALLMNLLDINDLDLFEAYNLASNEALIHVFAIFRHASKVEVTDELIHILGWFIHCWFVLSITD